MRGLYLNIFLIICFSIVSTVSTARNTVVKQITADVITVTPDRKQLQSLGWPNDIINSIAVNTGEGIVLVDTQNSPANAKLIKSAVMGHFNDSTFIYIINTHGHSCHSGGNCEFDQANIVAQSRSINEIKNYDDIFLGQTIDFFRKNILINNNVLDTITVAGALNDSINESIERFRFYEDDLLNNYKVRYPNYVFDDTLTLYAGNKTISLMYMGKGHGNADIMVYIEEDKVLCTGNLFHLGGSDVEEMPSFYVYRENEINHWISTMSTFLEKNNDVKYVLSTHGKKPFKLENIVFINEYCKLVRSEVKAAKASKQAVESLQSSEKFDNFFKNNRNIIGFSAKIQEMHKRNLNIIWRYIE
ncbi:MAG TPA: MBL fold metallo-hydrolase [Prolixibacteraceae bacterium]|nr:MBL fold metallo-hydrolase [Prolixibacteraceae bacterium]